LASNRSCHGCRGDIHEVNLRECARKTLQVDVVARSCTENAKATTRASGGRKDGLREPGAMRRVQVPVVVGTDHAGIMARSDPT
jgi:hypothetical protein